MEKGRYFRVKVAFLEPEKIDHSFIKQYGQEIDSDEIYLGIRLNPTRLKNSAAINSLELAHQYINIAKTQLISDFGQVSFLLREYSSNDDYVNSIVEIDSRTLMNFVQSQPYKLRQPQKIENPFFKGFKSHS